MKAIVRGYGANMTVQQKQNARTQAGDFTRTRGTSQAPLPPRGVIVQSASRGVLVSWSLPENVNADIQRWRVYKGDESTLFSEINDRGIRQCFVDATAGTTPPTVNIFVSSVNSLGSESPKVQVQGSALSETGAPAVPTAPLANIGISTSTNYLNRKQNEVLKLIQ